MEEFRIVLADACKIVKESSRKRVISGADEDGRVMVEFSEPVGGRRVKMLTPDEINGMLYKEETPESPANAEEAMAEETEPPTAGQEESGESALERIPKDAQTGEPQYTQTDADTAWDALVEQCGGDADMAQGVADSMVKDMETALKKAEKSAPAHGVTVAEKIAAAKGHKAAVEKARTELEKWRAIAGETASRARAAEEAERRRKKERLDAAREELRRNGRYAKEDAALGDYTDFADYAMRTIATGKYRFLWGDRESGTQGLGAHLGFTGSRTERNKRIWLLSKDGFTPEEAAERMLADYSAAAGFDSVGDTGVDSMEALDVILDVLRRYTSPRAMMDDAKAAHAENGESAEERRQGEEYERGQFMEAYHMTPEEYYEYENEWLPRYMEEAAQVPQEVIDNINAEYAEKYSENGKDDYNGGEDGRGVPPVQGERLDKPGGDEGGGDTGGAAGAVGEGDAAGGFVPQGASGREVRAGEVPQPVGKGAFGDIYDQFRGDAKAAFDFLTKHRSGDLLGVFHRDDTGDIDLVWGDENSGLSHILTKHVGKGKDFGTEQAAFDKIESILKNGKLIQDGRLRYVVSEDGYRVAIRKDYDGVKKNWIVTAVDYNRSKEEKEITTNPTSASHGANGPELAAPNNSKGKVTEESADLQENGGKDAGGKAEMPLSEQIDAASAEVNTEPTEAQKEAGNYKKGHVQVDTFDITIEQPEGSIRRGTDANGKHWESKMHNTYGYFRGTEGVDGDHIDVFLSNDIDGWNGRKVYVVDQYNPDGTFDEHKVMLGFNDMDEAKGDYLANYEKGWENGRRIDVSAVNLEDFEKWIASSHRKTKPFSEYKSVKPAGDRETFNGHKVENSGKDIEAQIKHLEEIKDYPGADKKIVQSEIDRLKAKEEAKAKSKSEEVKSKPKEENGVDDAKIDAVLEALDKGKEKAARRLASKLTNKELSKARSKAKPSFLLEYEWQWRAQNRGDVSLHDWMLENQYVEPVKRVSGTFRITDYTAPKDSPYAERLGGVFHDNSGFAVATDGRILVADKGSYDPKLKGKVIGKDGAAMENNFPNWQKAIPPAKETKSSNIDVEDLRKFVAGVLRANKRAYISLRFPDGTVEVFKANRLNLMLRAMKQLGTSELLYTKDGMKLVAKSEKGTALLMGLVSVEDELVEANGYAYPGNTVSYHRGEVVSEMSQEERVLRGAVIDRLRESGMEVITDEEAGQRVLDEASGKVRQMSFGEPYDYAAYPYGRVEPNLAEKEVNVVAADANHGFNNYKEAKTWAKQNVSKSYNDKETGGKGNVRISNAAIDKFLSQSAVDKSDSKDVHMAVLKVLPGLLKTSIDVETHPDFIKGEDGKRNAENGINKDVLVHRCYGAVSLDGELYRVKITLKEDPRDLSFPHVTHSYEATKIELLAGTWENRKSPSPNTSNSITAAKLLENVGMSYNPGEKVLAASEKRSANIREQRVYHGSGADFDRFDHSHIGEGEGNQAFGWGTYVTNSKDIGFYYATRIDNDPSKRSNLFQHSNGTRFKKKYPTLESFLQDTKRMAINGKVAEQEKIDYYHKMMKLAEPYHNLYAVEIPEDNGKNYLDWDSRVGARVLSKVNRQLEKQGKRPINPELSKRYKFLDGNDLYRALSIRMPNDDATFNDDKAASEFLYSLGFVGIKYKAGRNFGNAKEGDTNYVIFNEKDAKITDHVRFFRTAKGEAYGFTVGGKIYIDPKIANTETPIHEYAHLWAAALRGQNPKEWQNIVELMKGTSVWDEVKKRYPELNADDDIADEVLATYSGRRGAERLREEQRKIAGDKGGVFEKAEAISALERVKQALRKFWKSVADFLHIHYKSAEEVADRVMKDLLDGVDPGKHFNSRVLEEEEDVFGDTVAQLSGSEYALLKNNAEKNVRKYESRRKQWEADQTYIHNAKPKLEGQIKAAEKRAEEANAHLLAVQKAFPDGKFTEITVGKQKFSTVEDMADFIKEHNKKILDAVKAMKENPSNSSQTNTLTLSLGGYNFVVKTEMSRETVNSGGSLFAEIHRRMSYSCPELGLTDIPVKQSLLRNAVEDITENVITGKDFAERFDIATRMAKRGKSELEQMKQREGKPFEFGKELEEAERQLEEYTEAMKQELAEKEKKYAEMDASVEAATDIVADDEDETSDDKTKFRLLEDDDPKAIELESLPDSELVPVYRNAQAFEDDALGSPMAFTDAETGERRTLQGGKWNYSNPPQIELTPEQQRQLDELNKNGYIVVDDKKTTELQINDGLKFVKPKTKDAQLQYFLKKNPEDKGLWAAYDPYDHAIETPLNTQFAGAYNRPNLVVVRSLIPKSEIDEPFHADYALLPTGAHQWNNGRTLYLSRWSKIDKVLTREEEAKMIDEYWKKHPGKREALKSHRDYNRFVPQVRRELEKMGYRFELDGKELTPEESRALDEQNWESRDVIPGREGHTPFVSNEDIARINAKMSGKWVGEPKEAMENAMTARVNELAERLHTPVRIVRTDEEVAALPSARQRRMKGSFNPMTGEVTIVVPNNANMADVENTFIHEVVGHDGLRVLFPEEEKLNNALDELYRVSKDEIRNSIDRMAQKMYDAEVDRLREKKRKEHEANGEDSNASYYADMAEAHAEASKKREQFKRDATEEYGADLAGRIGEKGFEKMSAEELTFWGKLKSMLQNALRKLAEGLGIPGVRKWGDNEWAFVLHEAYKRKRNGGRPSVADAADTVSARESTGFDGGLYRVGDFVRQREQEGNLEEVNRRFNGRLDELTEENADEVRLELGMPNRILKASGIPGKPMVLYGNKIIKKANKHGFAPTDIKNLPKVLQSPIAVFEGSHKDSFAILTEMSIGGKNVLVSIETNKKGELDFNIISSVFGKNNKGVIDWVNKGKLLYADKEKALRYISASAHIADATYKAELDTAANVVRNFENPKVSGGKVSGEDLMFRDGDAKDYEKAQARDRYERRVSTGMFQSREAIQDSMLSLKVAMDAIEEATAGKAKRIENYDGFENAYLGENRLSSVNQAESTAFAHLLIRPMMEEVNRLAPTAEDRAELIDYMFAKHGLERNAYMRQQAAEKKLAEYKKQNPGTAKTAADFIDAERDYAGLTTLTGEADVSAAEAEAQRMVADYENDYTFHGTWNEIYVCRKKIC